MFIRNWYPEVKVEAVPLGNGRISPFLYLHALLGCPVCQAGNWTDSMIELDPWNVKYLKNLEYLVTRISAERHCGSCGVASIIPPELKKTFQGAVEEIVTSEWLASCVTQLGCSDGRKRVKTVQDTVESQDCYIAHEAQKGKSVRIKPALLLPGVEPSPV